MIDDDSGCIPSRQLKRVVSCPLSRLPQALLSDTAGPARLAAAPRHLIHIGSLARWCGKKRPHF